MGRREGPEGEFAIRVVPVVTSVSRPSGRCHAVAASSLTVTMSRRLYSSALARCDLHKPLRRGPRACGRAGVRGGRCLPRAHATGAAVVTASLLALRKRGQDQHANGSMRAGNADCTSGDTTLSNLNVMSPYPQKASLGSVHQLAFNSATTVSPPAPR